LKFIVFCYIGFWFGDSIFNAIFKNTNDEFYVKTASTLEEAYKLLEVGFEYVTDMDGVKLFRKRK
jgi:hypothetical protein